MDRLALGSRIQEIGEGVKGVEFAVLDPIKEKDRLLFSEKIDAKIFPGGIMRPLFSNEELKQLEACTADLIDIAIDSGNLDEAKRLNNRRTEENSQLQDLFAEWITGLMSHIYRRYGDDAFYQALKESWEGIVGPSSESFTQIDDVRKKAETLAAGLRIHFQPLKIIEDDEKITMMMQPCGTGGRLLLDKKYEQENLAKVKKAQHMTFGMEDFPIYCTHCAMQEIIALERTGEPLFAVEPPRKIGENPCQWHVFKDATKIPDRFYERVGKRRGKGK